MASLQMPHSGLRPLATTFLWVGTGIPLFSDTGFMLQFPPEAVRTLASPNLAQHLPFPEAMIRLTSDQPAFIGKGFSQSQKNYRFSLSWKP